MQQTAEYIDRLEQEKQRLVQQNQHLKRLLEQQEGSPNNNNNNNVEYPNIAQQQISTSPSTHTAASVMPSVNMKKRKLEAVMTIQTDSSDEGLGSMSPEPISQLINNNGVTTTTKTHTTHVINAPIASVTPKDYQDLQKQMETERQHRLKLEEELKNLQSQFYSSERIQFPSKYVYHRQNEQINGHAPEELAEDPRETIIQEPIEYAIDPQHHHHQYVVCTTVQSPESTPRHIQEVMIEDDDSSRTLSSDELNKDEQKLMLTTKRSPKHYNQTRMPSILEQAIKAEPKVEVERISSPSTIQIPCSEDAIHSPPPPRSITIACPPLRTYPTNSARPNLETIVEAIRHLEGDHLFDMVDQDEDKKPQEFPLALTKSKDMRQADIHPFLKFQSVPSQGQLPAIHVTTTKNLMQNQHVYQHNGHISAQNVQQNGQSLRPNVIVLKSNNNNS